MTDIGWRQSEIRVSLAEPGDYWRLLKPRVMSLVVFTAFVGMIVAPVHVDPVLGLVSLLAIAVGAGASGALNQWWDADIDAIMTRTRGRPIPAGRVTGEETLTYGLTLSAFSVMTLGLAANWLAAGLLAFTIFFYVVVYSMVLKRRTAQNIVIGGAAGALPPVVAWAAVTGSLDWAPIVLFALIFVWTPPHFWSLALLKSEDYARAGVPMLPVVAGESATRTQILAYSALLFPVGLMPWALGFAGVVHGVVAAVGGVVFVGLAAAVFVTRGGAAARKACGRLFGFSILHLFTLFAVLAGERLATAL
ncbi:MAG: heme o synthase [Siculibacillus sp.]|nr:heme o synthase [Siculibacillus sp.]